MTFDLEDLIIGALVLFEKGVIKHSLSVQSSTAMR